MTLVSLIVILDAVAGFGEVPLAVRRGHSTKTAAQRATKPNAAISFALIRSNRTNRAEASVVAGIAALATISGRRARRAAGAATTGNWDRPMASAAAGT